MPKGDLHWARLERWGYDDDPDDEDAEFVEIAHDGCDVFVCRGAMGTPGAVQRVAMASESAARVSASRRIAALEKNGWLRADATAHPVPSKAPKHQGAGRTRFAATKETFLAELRAREIDARPFVAQGAARRVSPNDIATSCLEAATLAFGVAFTGAYLDEREHDGETFPIAGDRVAEFYVSPANVARIARRKLDGKWEHHDGPWEPED